LVFIKGFMALNHCVLTLGQNHDTKLLPCQLNYVGNSDININLLKLAVDLSYGDYPFNGFSSSFSRLAREHCELDGDLLELQLGHIEGNKVKAAYDRSMRLEE
jgi:hypothetical protein